MCTCFQLLTYLRGYTNFEALVLVEVKINGGLLKNLCTEMEGRCMVSIQYTPSLGNERFTGTRESYMMIVYNTCDVLDGLPVSRFVLWITCLWFLSLIFSLRNSTLAST